MNRNWILLVPRMDNGTQDYNVLEVTDLQVHFPITTGLWRRTVGYVKAVDYVSFNLKAGETLGLVGESGCGKTTTGRAIMRAVAPTGGHVIYGNADGTRRDTMSPDSEDQRLLRQQIQLIFQDPFASLNPRMTLFDIVADPLRVNGIAKGRDLEDRVSEMLEVVGLSPAYMRRYPHAFSGGQRQRVGIARALVMNPSLVIADEPVSALDVSVQAQILNLMQDLQEQLGLTYLFISHDLSVVQYISHRVAVMYVGKIVELAPTELLFTEPKHPYTQALLSSVPVPDPTVRSLREPLEGEVADPANPPSGCYFHPRCPYAKDICKTTEPELRQVAQGHFSRCHFAEEIELPGVPA
jgi:peptide/nickel transport system ATP-binding protein